MYGCPHEHAFAVGAAANMNQSLIDSYKNCAAPTGNTCNRKFGTVLLHTNYILLTTMHAKFPIRFFVFSTASGAVIIA